MINLSNITYYLMNKLDENNLDVRMECLTSKLDSRVRVINNKDNQLIKEYQLDISDEYVSISNDNYVLKSYKSESYATNFMYDDIVERLQII